MSLLAPDQVVGTDAALDRRHVVGEVAATLAELARLRTATGWGFVEIRQPGPTAAFSRRDTLAPGYPSAAAAARAHGFDPVVRPVGGRLAAYHEGSLVIDVMARHPAPAAATDTRFRLLAGVLATALVTLGVDARVGAVPHEYCPGEFSVNAGGRTKLAGSAQRLTPGSFLLSTVVVVCDPEPVRSVLALAYPRLGLSFDPATVGCVSEHAGPVIPAQVSDVLLTGLARLLPLAQPWATADGVLRAELTGCWDPSP